MSSSLEKLGSCVVQAATGGATSTLESFWKNDTCIIAMFRRFGCKLCRLEAMNLSTMKPALDKRNVRLIGISFDSEGVNDFIKGGFFKGEVFVDPDRTTYKAMAYPKVSKTSGVASLFSKAGRDLNKEANNLKLSGNMSGDGWQTGGLLVVEKGGKVLYEYAQEKVVNHPDYVSISRALGIQPNELPEMSSATCGDDSCSRP